MDLKFALRTLSKNPGFTVLAILVMAVGIGATAAVFSVVNAVLLKPLPYADPDRIVTLSSSSRKTGMRGQVSAPDFHDWHDEATAFAAMAYYAYSDSESAVSVGSEGQYAHVATVSAEFFRVFSTKPVVGRQFSSDEEKTGSAVLISHAFSQRYFGSDVRALGQTIRMFGRTLNITGVLPPGFRFPGDTDIWFPVNTIFTDSPSRTAHNYLVVGRLKPNVSLKEAQAEMGAIGARLEREYPQAEKSHIVVVTRLSDEMVSNIRLTLFLVLAAVGVLLLIACTNMANLLLAQATVRTREIAIRSAVGASRGRIVRQLITESLTLSLIAGGVGLLLAVGGCRALVALAPSNVPRLAEASIDGRVLAFTLGISVLASLLFGLVPALQTSRVDFNNALKQSSSQAAGSFKTGGMRAALVAAEIALSFVLLIAAGLLIKSFIALHSVAIGLRPEHVLVMQTSVPASGLDGARRATRFYKDLLQEITRLPGVSTAGAARILPGRVISFGDYWIDHSGEITASTPQAVFSVVAPGTFATLGIPLNSGRDFNDNDNYDAPPTAIINQALAQKSFHGKDPIGRLIFCGFDSPLPMKIVGVVGNVRQYGPARESSPEVYMDYEQHPRTATALSILVRTPSKPAILSDVLRRMVHERSPDVPVQFTSMETSYFSSAVAPRFRAMLLGVLAGIALFLSVAGVYGVMAYVVRQKVKEIGIRMALGASSSDVLGLIFKHVLLVVGIGVALGLVGAATTTRLLASFLFEVKPSDSLTYALVALGLVLVALVAAIVPAWRAIHIDPLLALRQE